MITPHRASYGVLLAVRLARMQGRIEMTERLTITIETGNAAFQDDPCRELARILRAQADLIESGMAADETPLRDVNGNRVGICSIEEDSTCAS